ncbi:hypothetical protein D3C84_1129960 [compost metagenome]
MDNSISFDYLTNGWLAIRLEDVLDALDSIIDRGADFPKRFLYFIKPVFGDFRRQITLEIDHVPSEV